MSKIRLAIVFGGNSTEYPVSLHSVGSVLNNIDNSKYDISLIGISRQGEWYLYEGDVDTLEHDHWLESNKTTRVSLSPSVKEGFVVMSDDGSYKVLPVDCIFPVMHGKNGEDGTLQGLFEMAQIPYVGCNHTTSALAMDKEFTHIICESKGIKMAPYAIASISSFDIEQTKHDVKDLKLPYFVKPANAGSSFGITKVNTIDELETAIRFGFEHDEKVLIEEGIDGFEVGCSVLGNNADLTVGELDEIQTNNAFFDYDAKYELENTQIICPARIDDTIANEIKKQGKQIFQALGCKGLSRIDFFLSSKHEIYFNEINTIPGFTAASRYPTMMKNVGIDFTALIDQLVTLAMK